ncbi:hypothetical protein [Propionivibrio sp.]|uniref:hypothetical protein n=1 Tax=Propionivibrio sp. TaxID=2212460 RepID=UPI0025EC839E|nr:hypothetical protein [Propionivibrio sp.]
MKPRNSLPAYMIEAVDLNEAIQVAKIPPARVGSIEVRPIRPILRAGRCGSGAAAGPSSAEKCQF